MSFMEILQWWEAWLFAAIGGVIIWFIKISFNGIRETRRKEMKEFKQEVLNNMHNIVQENENKINKIIKDQDNEVMLYMKEEDKNLLQSLELINKQLLVNQKGLLSLQEKIFKAECKKLLEQEYITYEEMEHCSSNHVAYNDLGGNHHGDELFKMVENKFNTQSLK